MGVRQRSNPDEAIELVPAIMSRLDSSLTGSLPCMVCGYELQGLSVRGVCPECGTAVRGTILYRVDPRAEEFTPIRRRRLVATCLVMWSSGALAAAATLWLPRLCEAWATVTKSLNTPTVELAGRAAAVLAGLSGLSLLGVVRPTRETPIRKSLAMVGAVLAHGPLVWSMLVIDRIDATRPIAYFTDSPSIERIVLRLVEAVSMVVILLGVRPVARDLVKRSLVLRTGRVDRQTILAMSGVVVIGAIGDLLRLWTAVSPRGEVWLPAAIGTLIVAFTSVLLTLGLVSALVDSARIHKAILIPSPSLEKLTGE
ncbi:MAG TPA: hypothetical protein VG797_06925 [Phycisphaerales bacterium]|nr:hypothetical protein [Phycisphaerales bacterium]